MRRKPTIYNRFVRSRTTVEKIRLVGPMAQGRAVMDALHADGYRLTRSGPLVTKFPTVDPERFDFRAEREVPNAE